MRDTDGRGMGMGMYDDEDEDENDDGAFGFGGGRKKRFTAAGVDSDEEDEGFRKGVELKQDTVSLDQVCLIFLLARVLALRCLSVVWRTAGSPRRVIAITICVRESGE